jgi:hypothetical protein
MKTIYIAMFMIIALFAKSQKIDEHYIATKTHDTIVTTKWTKVEKSDAFLLSFRLAKHNSQYAIELKFNFGDGPAFSVKKHDSVMIKFKSGWGFSLFSKDSVKSKIGMSSYPGSLTGLVTQGLYVIYPMTLGQVIALKTDQIEKMRIYSSRGFDNYIFLKYDYEYFMKSAIAITTPIAEWILVDYMKEDKPDDIMEGQKDEKW